MICGGYRVLLISSDILWMLTGSGDRDSGSAATGGFR